VLPTNSANLSAYHTLGGGLTEKLKSMGADPTLEARIAAVIAGTPPEMLPTPPTVYNTGDPLRDMSNFFAGWADTLTFGLTQKLRQSLGYDDAVDKSSGMYGLGQTVGTVHSLIISFGAGGVANAGLRSFMKGLDVVRAGAGVSSSVDKIRNGDVAGGLLEIGGTVTGLAETSIGSVECHHHDENSSCCARRPRRADPRLRTPPRLRPLRPLHSGVPDVRGNWQRGR